MAYDLEAREFNSAKRAGELAEALGEIGKEFLGSLTVTNTAYTITPESLGIATNYLMTFNTSDNVTDEVVNFTYNSTGSETMSELLEAIVAEGNTNYGARLFWSSKVSYTDDFDMYFTVTTKSGFRLLSAPTFTNILDTQTSVQAPIGKPAAHTAYNNNPNVEYPRLIVTPLPITSVDENFKSGTIDTGDDPLNPVYTPYYDAYIKANYKLTVEAGGYNEILEQGMSTAEDILRRIRSRMMQDNIYREFLEKIDATITDKWVISPAPMLSEMDWRSIASTTITLDIIERYLDPLGGVITEVIIEPTSTLVEKGDENTAISVGQIITRPDHV